MNQGEWDEVARGHRSMHQTTNAAKAISTMKTTATGHSLASLAARTQVTMHAPSDAQPWPHAFRLWSCRTQASLAPPLERQEPTAQAWTSRVPLAHRAASSSGRA